MRINRYLATTGLGSRRSVEEYILSGRVKINNVVVTDLSAQVEEGDEVKVGSEVVRPPKSNFYAMMNKPRGYVCTASDELGRKTIYQLMPRNWPKLKYVGRLDMESEGLLLLTNDGVLVNALAHPKLEIRKEYEVGLTSPFDPKHKAKLLKGMIIEAGKAKAEEVEIDAPTVLRITLTQGLKRQIRDMLYRIGYETEWLRRIRLGPLKMGDLPRGAMRELMSHEVQHLRRAAGLFTPKQARQKPRVASRKSAEEEDDGE